MKVIKKKYLLIALVVLLLVGTTFVTYSIYRNNYSGSGTVGAATWAVKVKKGSTEVQNLNFGLEDITWTKHNGKNGTIAPGDKGYIEYTIDASGSEVNVDYDVTVGTITNGTGGFNVEANPSSGVIFYATGSGAMTKTIRLNVVWDASLDDDSSKDSSDVGTGNKTLTIPVTITLKQSFYGYVVSKTKTYIGSPIPQYVNFRSTSAEAINDWENITQTAGDTRPFYVRLDFQGGVITDASVEFVISDAMATANEGLVAGTYNIQSGYSGNTFTERMNFIKKVFDYDNHPSRCQGDQTSYFVCGINGLSIDTGSGGNVHANDAATYATSTYHCLMDNDGSTNCYIIT